MPNAATSLLPSLLNAIPTRKYTKGRDLHDLAWYLAVPSWPEAGSGSTLVQCRRPRYHGDVSDCCSSEKPSSDHNRKSSCCGSSEPEEKKSSCCSPKRKIDWLLWGSLGIITLAYVGHLIFHSSLQEIAYLGTFTHGSFELMNTMWWGVVFGMVAVGLMHQVPRDAVTKALGPPGTVRGIARAMLAGLVLDLCNHGILMVAMKLFERGASLGQVYAFLIASPWNSLSLTIILISLVGLPLTLLFIIASALIAFITGWMVEKWVRPKRQDHQQAEVSERPWKELWQECRSSFPDRKTAAFTILRDGLTESRMILRWVFFGVVLASLIRAFFTPETFQDWFGPGIAGLLLTLLAATVIEVCSEGSTPIAADLVTRAGAPGNGFTFLMAGAATDYTEIMVLRETTGRWAHAFLLPALTVPQILAIGALINTYLA
jgi:uncharacterized membrane protein YraQ (UPF0718 family)